jgi:hypothetical protein
MFCQQNAGQNYDIKGDNKSYEYVAKFRCLGRALTKETTFISQVGIDQIQGLPLTIQFRIFVFLCVLSKDKNIKV